MELELHPIQSDILLVLLLRPTAKFSEMNTTKASTDLFTFHLKRLVKLGLVKKTSKLLYRLTTKGKEFANRFDTESVVLERQTKTAILLVCHRKRRGKTEYLVSQRLKQPYYGYYGNVTGKVRWGETIIEGANRELKEETNLTGKPKLVGIKHKIDYSKNGKLLEDKIFYVFSVRSPKGKMKVEFEGGKNIWMTKPELLKLDKLFEGLEERIRMVGNKHLEFGEDRFKVSGY